MNKQTENQVQTIKDFIRYALLPDTRARTRAATIIKYYQQYCGMVGSKAVGVKTFGMALARHFWHAKSDGVRYYMCRLNRDVIVDEAVPSKLKEVAE